MAIERSQIRLFFIEARFRVQGMEEWEKGKLETVRYTRWEGEGGTGDGRGGK